MEQMEVSNEGYTNGLDGETTGMKKTQMQEEEDITTLGVFKQLYKVGAYPLMLILLLDWIAKSAACKTLTLFF